MALPYERKFTSGRTSELLYNEDLHKKYEVMRHYLDDPPEGAVPEKAKIDGALWADRKKNELLWYSKAKRQYVPFFGNKFQLIDQIMNIYPPESPIIGQLWLNNGMLMYWDGSNWVPVKAMEQDGSQFDMAFFENHIMVSPLYRTGNAVINDDNERILQDIREGKLDMENHSEFHGTGDKWTFSNYHDEHPTREPHLEGYSQFLLPNLKVDRFFVDEELRFDYDEVSKVCIQMEQNKLLNKRVSAIHVNPGHLRRITKKLLKIDKVNGKIYFKSDNYELYGFRHDSPLGDLLVPEKDTNNDGYRPTDFGAILNRHQMQNYDYVVLIDFDFTWLKTTGRLTHVTNLSTNTSYYIPNFKPPYNIFVQGYNLEEFAFKEHSLAKTITINEQTDDLDVTGFNTPLREFGLIRDVDLEERGIVKPLKTYHSPLFFINGEAFHFVDGLTYENGVFKIPGAMTNMVWGVAELHGDKEDPDYDMYVKNGAGFVTDYEGLIFYDKTDVKDTDALILFIDGMMIKPSDLVIDRKRGCVTTEGICQGQSYILLKDRYNRIHNEDTLQPAFWTDKLSESLVYVDGNFICNNVAINETNSLDNTPGKHNEVKFFIDSEASRNQITGSFYIYEESYNAAGEDTSKWRKLDTNSAEDEAIIAAAGVICNSYQNTTSAVTINYERLRENFNIDPYRVDVYGFKYASYDGQPLTIRNIEVDPTKDNENPYTEDNKHFRIFDYFVPYRNLISVWINGVRQHEIIEDADGMGFTLPEALKVSSKVTYVIETTDNLEPDYINLIHLDEHNVVPNTTNVYRTFPQDTEIGMPETLPSLYPGRVVVYVDGVRQPQHAFTVLDNYTILFNDPNQTLTGNKNNYPREVIDIDDKTGAFATMNHFRANKILIEVRQDYEKSECYTQMDSSSTDFAIHVENHNIPAEILDTNDEILIFIDGLFMGLKNYDGSKFTYMRNISRGVIELNEPGVINRIMTDPLYEYLKMNPKAMTEYRNTHNNKEYKPRAKHVILEWRDI